MMLYIYLEDYAVGLQLAQVKNAGVGLRCGVGLRGRTARSQSRRVPPQNKLLLLFNFPTPVPGQSVPGDAPGVSLRCIVRGWHPCPHSIPPVLAVFPQRHRCLRAGVPGTGQRVHRKLPHAALQHRPIAGRGGGTMVAAVPALLLSDDAGLPQTQRGTHC